MGGAKGGFGRGGFRLSGIAGITAGLEDVCVAAWETRRVVSSEGQARGVLGESGRGVRGGTVGGVFGCGSG